ncbi:hypothetical protein ACO29I_03605 [Eggerthellaceae bacterium DNF00809]
MNTKLLDTLKEKWTKKSTKIACASVGTVAVLGVVGALIACNLPHTEQVIAEDGTITTVQTPQKESHGLFDIFHAPTEQADAAQTTTTEIAPPQTNADGTPINASTTVPGTPQAAASGSVDNVTGTAAAAPASESAAPAPAPAAVEQSPAPAEESSAPAPAAQANQWVKPVWVVDQPEVKAIPPKYNVIKGLMTSDGKFFPYSQQDEAYEYQLKHKLGIGNREKRELIDPGRPYSPEKGHWEDPTTGKRLSPTYERSH